MLKAIGHVLENVLVVLVVLLVCTCPTWSGLWDLGFRGFWQVLTVGPEHLVTLACYAAIQLFCLYVLLLFCVNVVRD
jgi:hypothetical protein